MLIIDAHLDLAMNALNWNRDLTLGVHEIRKREEGMTQKGRAMGTVAFPEMRVGRVAVSIATVIARVARQGNPLSGYSSAEIAYAQAQGQLAYYRILESQGKLRIITDWKSLESHVDAWEENETESLPLAIIISMEGADPIISPDQVPGWWNDGLRIVGLSHYGVSNYAHGTGTSGGLTPMGRPLLKAMSEVGMILDLTHLADESFWEAIDYFDGPVLASHNNCRALVPGDRQFSDDQVKKIIERDGVIGSAMDAWMLYPGWVKGETSNTVVNLETVVNHMDHICQLAGNARHVAIGTDLDGGYGYEQTPHDLETIADLQKIPNILEKRGYNEGDIRGIMHGNWLRLLRDAWETKSS
ncbi:membrane dipeptidase [Candidatus Poribacteria bacterium]|nr:membrane dipeptidase [Candidatus Poribacteria bacterium]